MQLTLTSLAGREIKARGKDREYCSICIIIMESFLSKSSGLLVVGVDHLRLMCSKRDTKSWAARKMPTTPMRFRSSDKTKRRTGCFISQARSSFSSIIYSSVTLKTCRPYQNCPSSRSKAARRVEEDSSHFYLEKREKTQMSRSEL